MWVFSDSMGISACNAAAIDPHVYQTFNNTLYSPASAFSNGPCKDFVSVHAALLSADCSV